MGILNPGERSTVESALGSGCKIHSTTVVRVYTSSGGSWEQKCMGAAAIVTDSGKSSHYLKVVDLDGSNVSFTQELYENFSYEQPRPFFHTFETDTEVAGFSFADEGEASEFASKVQYCIETPAGEASAGSGAASSAAASAPPPPTSRPGPPPPRPGGPPPPPTSSAAPTPAPAAAPAAAPTKAAPAASKKKSGGGFMSKMFGKRDQEDELVLSEPTGFRHLSSIGWNADSGFEIRNIPPEWKKLFQSAGIKKKELKDANTAAFIMKTIEENGGLEAVAAGGPPPPPPPAPGAPPAPPAPGAPPPPRAAPAPPADTGGRGDLLSAIRAGKQLAHVDESAKAGGGPSEAGMAGILAGAISARRTAIGDEADQEEDEDWSDDDWE